LTLKMTFTIIAVVIVYLIIFYALKIMYKDIKNGGKKKTVRKTLGLEIVEAGENKNLRKGGVLPVHREITMGRKEDNTLPLVDPYVSGHHAKIYLKNAEYILEDLGSTNGTLLNNQKVIGKSAIKAGDEIKIGKVIFKVI